MFIIIIYDYLILDTIDQTYIIITIEKQTLSSLTCFSEHVTFCRRTHKITTSNATVIQISNIIFSYTCVHYPIIQCINKLISLYI